MTRYHGIKESTSGQIIIDSGAVYYNFTDLDNMGTLLGATRGGSTFKRKPKYIELPYEGVPGSVIGGMHLTGVEVTIETNIITFNNDNILLSVPNSVDSDGFLTETTWDSSAVHKIDNIAIVGNVNGSDQPIIIKINNPICISDLEFSFKDKSEIVSKWVFKAYYDPSDGFESAPWSIRFNEFILIDDTVNVLTDGSGNILVF